MNTELFEQIPEDYRTQVMRACMEMQAESHFLTVPLSRPIKTFLDTDPLPPMFQPLPTIRLRRSNEHPPFKWIPDGDVENI